MARERVEAERSAVLWNTRSNITDLLVSRDHDAVKVTK